ncbi:nucleotidyltransferase domain-containing protein [Mumia sp. zg.B17]|uniref:nucleotidyltransferase family protein n=1 Tax=Mumia sp. zg.B17 TaxID=2855446 RepID=UPI001C6E140A|nr:nucleotidyltransferase domain-containing protein [Mumia sp. zg.B17]MBW9205369.1 nucleotidyltransferase domain-containing protein [Mumia sp. zg.B17]
MALTLDHDAIAVLCRRHRVTRLTVFGSATTADFDPRRSDVDFLAEFTSDAGLSDYFGLKADLEELLGRPVDLVSPRALENPFFAATARETAEDVYAA